MQQLALECPESAAIHEDYLNNHCTDADSTSVGTFCAGSEVPVLALEGLSVAYPGFRWSHRVSSEWHAKKQSLIKELFQPEHLFGDVTKLVKAKTCACAMRSPGNTPLDTMQQYQTLLQAKAKAKASAKAVAKAKAKVRALATVHKCAPPSVKIIMGGFPCKDVCPLNIHMDTQAVENVSRQTGVVWKAILAWINAHPDTEFGIFENVVGLDNIGKKQRQAATAKAKLRAAKANTKAKAAKKRSSATTATTENGTSGTETTTKGKRGTKKRPATASKSRPKKKARRMGPKDMGNILKSILTDHRGGTSSLDEIIGKFIAEACGRKTATANTNSKPTAKAKSTPKASGASATSKAQNRSTPGPKAAAKAKGKGKKDTAQSNDDATHPITPQPELHPSSPPRKRRDIVFDVPAGSGLRESDAAVAVPASSQCTQNRARPLLRRCISRTALAQHSKAKGPSDPVPSRKFQDGVRMKTSLDRCQEQLSARGFWSRAWVVDCAELGYIQSRRRYWILTARRLFLNRYGVTDIELERLCDTLMVIAKRGHDRQELEDVLLPDSHPIIQRHILSLVQAHRAANTPPAPASPRPTVPGSPPQNVDDVADSGSPPQAVCPRPTEVPIAVADASDAQTLLDTQTLLPPPPLETQTLLYDESQALHDMMLAGDAAASAAAVPATQAVPEAAAPAGDAAVASVPLTQAALEEATGQPARSDDPKKQKAPKWHEHHKTAYKQKQLTWPPTRCQSDRAMSYPGLWELSDREYEVLAFHFPEVTRIIGSRFILDISQKIGWAKNPQDRPVDCGVVTPNAMLVSLDKMRVLRGLEKLWMQGIYHTGRRQQVVEQLAVTDDTLLGDTGGNAFAMKSFGAVMFTLHHMRAVLQHFLVTGKLVVPEIADAAAASCVASTPVQPADSPAKCQDLGLVAAMARAASPGSALTPPSAKHAVARKIWMRSVLDSDSDSE